jgi:hypothetical protein
MYKKNGLPEEGRPYHHQYLWPGVPRQVVPEGVVETGQSPNQQEHVHRCLNSGKDILKIATCCQFAKQFIVAVTGL